MKFCEECGAQLEDDAVFCEECGSPVSQDSMQDIVVQNSENQGENNSGAESFQGQSELNGDTFQKNTNKKKSSSTPVIVTLICVIIAAAAVVGFLYMNGTIGGKTKEKGNITADKEFQKPKASEESKETAEPEATETAKPTATPKGTDYSLYNSMLQSNLELYGFLQYTYTDLDNDGTEELIIEAEKESGADTINVVYTIAEGKVKKIGDFGMAVMLYSSPDGEGIYAVYGQMGYEVVNQITKKGEEIVSENVVSRDVKNDEYYSNDYPIKWKTMQDDSEDYSEDYSEEESEYICPDSDTEKLTVKEVKKLSKKERRLARNEIYARYGRLFLDEELMDYFNSKSWYWGYIEPEEFNENCLTKVEKYNVRLLKKYE